MLNGDLKASLYVAHDNITDENPVLEPQESMSKTQLQVNKKLLKRKESLVSIIIIHKYFKLIISEDGFTLVHEYVDEHIFCRKFIV